jgi:hypothetical protein
MSQTILMAISIVWFTNCVSSSPEPSVVSELAVPKAKTALNCTSTGVTFCTKEYAPTVCQLGDKRLSADEKDNHLAWGNNPCLARQILFKQLCDSGSVDYYIDDLQCRPSASEGNCPPSQPPCDKSLKQKTSCRASIYKDQKIPDGYQLLGEGTDDCDARMRLMWEACKLNLDPSGLSQIKCD